MKFSSLSLALVALAPLALSLSACVDDDHYGHRHGYHSRPGTTVVIDNDRDRGYRGGRDYRDRDRRDYRDRDYSRDRDYRGSSSRTTTYRTYDDGRRYDRDRDVSTTRTTTRRVNVSY